MATEVLEHLYEPSRAINEIYRILKPGGICILSTRFIFPYHGITKETDHYRDYYRFTWDSLNYLFRKFSKVEIYHHGNKIQALWQILNSGILIIVLNIFNPIIARIRFKKTICPCGFVVYAVK
ncbi:MAG: methyltransferase domain-containing protein [Desulfobacteraceae bacterium]|nr:methyltransferase domain-containing protein [Desulfobacteraceae bacterium]